jgi:hypothetical protein
MTRLRVLVTDADSTKALAVVRALGPTMDVWTTSGSRFPLAAWSRYTRRHMMFPTRPEAGYARGVLAICERNAIAAVVTPEERSSYLLAREGTAFKEAGVLLTTAPAETL